MPAKKLRSHANNEAVIQSNQDERLALQIGVEEEETYNIVRARILARGIVKEGKKRKTQTREKKWRLIKVLNNSRPI